VEALVDRSSDIAFSVRGMYCMSRTSKYFSSLRCMKQIGSQLQVITGAISLDLLDNELGVSFDEELPDPQR
jgi:hypothetical protein